MDKKDYLKSMVAAGIVGTAAVVGTAVTVGVAALRRLSFLFCTCYPLRYVFQSKQVHITFERRHEGITCDTQ